MAIQQRSQLKGFGQSTNEKYLVQDINDLIQFANNPQGGTNPTSTFLPVNVGGVFQDSKINQSSTIFNVNQETPSVFSSLSSFKPYNIKFNQNYWSIGMDDGLSIISGAYKWGVNFDYSSFQMYAGFGKSEGNGLYSSYNQRTTIGMNGSYFGVNQVGQLTSNMLQNNPYGFSFGTLFYNYLELQIGGTTYKIPLL